MGTIQGSFWVHDGIWALDPIIRVLGPLGKDLEFRRGFARCAAHKIACPEAVCNVSQPALMSNALVTDTHCRG